MSRKVAIQLISTGGVYGAEKVLLELAGYLHAQGWDSRVLALEGQGAADLVRQASARGVAAEAFVPQGRMPLLPLLRRLRAYLSNVPQAIVHSHGYKPDLLLSWLKVPARLGCVATCHSAYSEIRKLRFLETMDRRVLKGFDRAVAVSPQIRDELLAAGVSSERVLLISNGISVLRPDARARERVRAEFGLPPRSPLIVQIGRLVRLKRIDLLLAAMAALPYGAATHLLLVGEGPLRGALEAQVASSSCRERVHFCGYRHDVPRLLAAADVFVLNSDSEGSPVTILEAMALRCPIVATNVGSIPQLLAAGKDAWLVPAGDAPALAAALGEALGDPAQAQIRAASAYERFLLEYSGEAMGRRYLRVYESVWTARGWD